MVFFKTRPNNNLSQSIALPLQGPRAAVDNREMRADSVASRLKRNQSVETHKTTDEARQGKSGGQMRWVLSISTLLTMAIFLIIYIIVVIDAPHQ